MKRYCYLTLALFLLATSAGAQTGNTPVEVTAELVTKIQQQITGEETLLANNLKKKKDKGSLVEFTLDTFRVNRYMGLYMSYDYSTAGMRTATYEAAASYDSLLNKYYKLLIATLNPADRSKLVAAQRAWLAYRDNEMHLIEVLCKEEYSGGGTIQQLVEASNYLAIIKDRTLTIFDYYERATGNH